MSDKMERAGDALRRHRKAKGLTLRKLGELVGGYSAQYICDLERSNRSMPLLFARKLAVVLDAPEIAELAEGEYPIQISKAEYESLCEIARLYAKQEENQ